MCQQFAAAARGRSSPRSWELAELPEPPPLCQALAGGSSRAAPRAPTQAAAALGSGSVSSQRERGV